MLMGILTGKDGRGQCASGLAGFAFAKKILLQLYTPEREFARAKAVECLRVCNLSLWELLASVLW
jgi:hypothetical protein